MSIAESAKVLLILMLMFGEPGVDVDDDDAVVVIILVVVGMAPGSYGLSGGDDLSNPPSPPISSFSFFLLVYITIFLYTTSLSSSLKNIVFVCASCRGDGPALGIFYVCVSLLLCTVLILVDTYVRQMGVIELVYMYSVNGGAEKKVRGLAIFSRNWVSRDIKGNNSWGLLKDREGLQTEKNDYKVNSFLQHKYFCNSPWAEI